MAGSNESEELRVVSMATGVSSVYGAGKTPKKKTAGKNGITPHKTTKKRKGNKFYTTRMGEQQGNAKKKTERGNRGVD